MLSLEPVFCKSTGAYRAHVSQFCHVVPSLTDHFKLALARKPAELDSECWVSSSAPSGLGLNQNILVEHGVRSILKRAETRVIVLTDLRNGFLVELPEQELSAEGLVTSLAKRFHSDSASMAVTLLRHGILSSENEASLRSPGPSGVFQAENCIEVLRVESRTLIRNIFSGRAVEMTENPAMAELIESRTVQRAKEDDFATFEYLCRLGIFKQLWSQK